MKTRLLSCLLAVAGVLCAQAYDFSATNDDGVTIYYNITDDTGLEVAVTYHHIGSSYSGDVVIPSSVAYGGNTYRVTGIGTFAFSDCISLTSVTLPEGLTSIAVDAFSDCSSLASVTLPEGLTSIGGYAFYRCDGLASITIPESVTSIGNDAFGGCTNLTTLEFNAENCTTCGSSSDPAFPSAVSNLTIGDKVTSIPSYSFYGCRSLESVTIPNSVVSIGSNAFPSYIAKVFWLGNTPPTGYGNVTALVHYVSNDQYSQLSKQRQYQFLSSMFTVDGTVYVPVSPSERTCDVVDCVYSDEYADITIADKVTNRGAELSVLSINPYAFYNNDYVQQIHISHKGEIGEKAFYDCDGIDSLYVANSGDVGTQAFYECGVQTATIQNGGDIGSYAFYDCDSLQTVTIQNDGNIASQAFYNCNSLQIATIKNNGNIASQAFYYCISLQTATIQNTGEIGSSAFYGCGKLSDAVLGERITGIQQEAFSGCAALAEFVIPDSVTTLGESAFADCSSLASISIGTGVPSLPERVFSGCASLDSLFIPKNIASVGHYAFAGCTSLSDVFMEEAEIEEGETNVQPFPDWTSTNHDDSSTSYEEYSFQVMPGDRLTFNYSVSSGPFDFLIITLDGVQIVEVYGSKTGSYEKVFEDSGQVTLHVSYTKDSYGQSGSDEASVTDIWLNAPVSGTAYLALGSNGSNPLFADCPLDEVYIGRKLSYQTGSSYGYSPFYRNTSLRTVEITDAETQIYDNEFYGCSNLASLKIGNGVTSIGSWAFSGCSSLGYFSAGYQVDTIGTEAFSDCTGLTKYYSYSIVPPGCGDQALDDINKRECTLYVPDESTDEYQAAPQWKDFFLMEEMEAVLVAEIKLNQTEASLAPNDTVRLTAQILPANATDPTVVWSTSDESIATVDETGLVTALAEGTATITAKSQDGNAEATCTITVETGEPTTGIDAVTTEEAEIEVYNLHGHQVGNSIEDLPAGVYIIKEGNRTYKTVVR